MYFSLSGISKSSYHCHNNLDPQATSAINAACAGSRYRIVFIDELSEDIFSNIMSVWEKLIADRVLK